MTFVASNIYSATAALGQLMPGETIKPNQQTWRSWLQEGEPDPARLITRDEMLNRLHAMNVDVKTSDLRYWEYEGVLPRPVRKWDPEVKARRAYYPLWFMASIITLRELQEAGLQLRDLPPALQLAAAEAAQELAHIESGIEEQDLIEDGVTEDDVFNAIVLVSAVHSILRVVFFDSVIPALTRYARLLDRLDVIQGEGKQTRHAEIRFTDDVGKTTWKENRFRLPNVDGSW